MLKNYKLTVPANSEISLAINGDFVRIDSLTGSVIVKTLNGDSIEMREGKRINFEPFKEIIFENTNGSEITFTAEIGTGFSDVAELSGTVDVETVINPVEFDNTQYTGIIEAPQNDYTVQLTDKNSFISNIYVAPVSARYGIHHLCNPIGSGKTFIVDAIFCNTSASFGVIELCFDMAEFPSTGGFIRPTLNPKNKYLGQSDSVGLYKNISGGSRINNYATVLSYIAGRYETVDILQGQKIIMPPESSLFIGNSYSNYGIYGSIHYREV